MIVKKKINTIGNNDWYEIYSDTEGKAILQQETNIIYGSVAMRDDDPHTYVECDDPNYNPEPEEDEEEEPVEEEVEDN